MITPELCPLCKSSSEVFFEDKTKLYFICSNCKAVFLDKKSLPDFEMEAARYKEHNNDVNDIRYQKFVSPIVNEITSCFTTESIGLDFGAGTGPVISKLLSEMNYNVKLYDPFFHNFPELLKRKYDYIACCEVIEHFHNPDKEFKLLKELLNENGKLYCMTSIYNESIDFKNWYYKNDPTHVFIYQQDTLSYICKTYGFSDVKFINNLIVFSN
jgi:SAM-dependent methyltransferase